MSNFYEATVATVFPNPAPHGTSICWFPIQFHCGGGGGGNNKLLSHDLCVLPL